MTENKAHAVTKFEINKDQGFFSAERKRKLMQILIEKNEACNSFLWAFWIVVYGLIQSIFLFSLVLFFTSQRKNSDFEKLLCEGTQFNLIDCS